MTGASNPGGPRWQCRPARCAGAMCAMRRKYSQAKKVYMTKGSTDNKLPLVHLWMSGPELAVSLHNAANALEARGRMALSASVFGIGTRLRMTAAALHACVRLLLEPELERPSPTAPEILEARESLTHLVRFTPWYDAELRSYWLALGRLLDRSSRALSSWPDIFSTDDEAETPSSSH